MNVKGFTLYTFNDLLHLFWGQRQFAIDIENQFGSHATEILFTRSDDESTHIDCSWTDDVLVVTLGGITRRTVLATRQHHAEQHIVRTPYDDIHHGLCTVVGRR